MHTHNFIFVFEHSNFHKFIWYMAYGQFLSYATLGGFVPCLGDEVLKLPWRLIFNGFLSEDYQKP